MQGVSRRFELEEEDDELLPEGLFLADNSSLRRRVWKLSGLPKSNGVLAAFCLASLSTLIATDGS